MEAATAQPVYGTANAISNNGSSGNTTCVVSNTTAASVRYESSSLSLTSSSGVVVRPAGYAVHGLGALWFTNATLRSQSGPNRFVTVDTEVPGALKATTSGTPSLETVVNSSLATTAVAEFSAVTAAATYCPYAGQSMDLTVAWVTAAAPFTTLPPPTPRSCYNLTWVAPGTGGRLMGAGFTSDKLPLYVCRAAAPLAKLWRVPGVTSDAWKYCAVYVGGQVMQLDSYEVLLASDAFKWTR
jgi:hypothetical protein